MDKNKKVKGKTVFWFGLIGAILGILSQILVIVTQTYGALGFKAGLYSSFGELNMSIIGIIIFTLGLVGAIIIENKINIGRALVFLSGILGLLLVVNSSLPSILLLIAGVLSMTKK